MLSEGQRNDINFAIPLLEHVNIERSSVLADRGYDSQNLIDYIYEKGGEPTMEIQVPQDRRSTFEPQVVKKRQKDISDIDQKIISMYAKGMTTRQISDTLEDIYGFEASEGFISDVTDKLMPQIEVILSRLVDTFSSRIFPYAASFSES